MAATDYCNESGGLTPESSKKRPYRPVAVIDETLQELRESLAESLEPKPRVVLCTHSVEVQGKVNFCIGDRVRSDDLVGEIIGITPTRVILRVDPNDGYRRRIVAPDFRYLDILNSRIDDTPTGPLTLAVEDNKVVALRDLADAVDLLEIISMSGEEVPDAAKVAGRFYDKFTAAVEAECAKVWPMSAASSQEATQP